MCRYKGGKGRAKGIDRKVERWIGRWVGRYVGRFSVVSVRGRKIEES